MRRLAMIVFAVAALSLCGLAGGPLVTGTSSQVHAGRDRVESVVAHAIPHLVSIPHGARGGARAAITPSATIAWVLLSCGLLASLGSMQRHTRTHARSQPSRAPPSSLR